jgi:hypothetical protein
VVSFTSSPSQLYFQNFCTRTDPLPSRSTNSASKHSTENSTVFGNRVGRRVAGILERLYDMHQCWCRIILSDQRVSTQCSAKTTPESGHNSRTSPPALHPVWSSFVTNDVKRSPSFTNLLLSLARPWMLSDLSVAGTDSTLFSAIHRGYVNVLVTHQKGIRARS